MQALLATPESSVAFAEKVWERFCQLVAIDAGLAKDGPNGFEMLHMPGATKQKGERYTHGCFLGSISKHRKLYMKAVHETLHPSTPQP